MADEGTRTSEVVEEYGPAWAPGPFEAGTDGPGVVLVGIDGSRTGLRAGAYAAGLARRQHSRLVVVHVLSPSAWTGVMPVAAAAEADVFDATIGEIRQQIRQRADEMAVPVTFVVRRGDVVGQLRQAATERRADLVVVGSSEQAGHRLVGSIATRLVRAGRWPVTVVP